MKRHRNQSFEEKEKILEKEKKKFEERENEEDEDVIGGAFSFQNILDVERSNLEFEEYNEKKYHSSFTTIPMTSSSSSSTTATPAISSPSSSKITTATFHSLSTPSSSTASSPSSSSNEDFCSSTITTTSFHSLSTPSSSTATTIAASTTPFGFSATTSFGLPPSTAFASPSTTTSFSLPSSTTILPFNKQGTSQNPYYSFSDTKSIDNYTFDFYLHPTVNRIYCKECKKEFCGIFEFTQHAIFHCYKNTFSITAKGYEKVKIAKEIIQKKPDDFYFSEKLFKKTNLDFVNNSNDENNNGNNTIIDTNNNINNNSNNNNNNIINNKNAIPVHPLPIPNQSSPNNQSNQNNYKLVETEKDRKINKEPTFEESSIQNEFPKSKVKSNSETSYCNDNFGLIKNAKETNSKDLVFEEFSIPDDNDEEEDEEEHSLYQLMDQDYLLSDSTREEFELYERFCENITMKIKNFGKKRKEEEKPKEITLDTVIREIPKCVIYVILKMTRSENHIKKHVKPFINLQELYKGRKPHGIDRIEIENHKKSLKKKLCSAVVLGNMFVNSADSSNPTTLKTLSTIALREQNLNCEGISSMSGIGYSKSSRNFLKLLKESELINNMVKTKWEKITPSIRSGAILFLGDNLYFQKKKFNVGPKTEKKGISTTTNALIGLLNPGDDILKCAKDIPKIDKDDIDINAFKCNQKQIEAWSNAFEDCFKIIQTKRENIDEFKSEMKKDCNEIVHITMQSRMGGDGGKDNNLQNQRYIEKQIKEKTSIDINKKNRLYIADEKGTSAISSLTFKQTTPEIEVLPFPGDFHILVNAHDACTEFYENFLYPLGCHINVTTEWKTITSGNHKLPAAKKVVKYVFYLSLKELISFFQNRKMEIGSCGELFDATQKYFDELIDQKSGI